MTRSPMSTLLPALGAAAWLAGPARAADTVETWDAGATDLDFYLGFDGIDSGDGTSYGDIMLGYGILDRFSAYLGTTLEGDQALGNGDASTYFGFFGTPVNTAHFDLDVFLNVSSGGGKLELAPAIELNLDLDPDMRTWGAYLRAQLPVHGRHVAAGPLAEPPPASGATYHVASVLGAYRTIAPGHQLLVEYGVDFHPDEQDGVRTVDVCGVAVGYNVALNDTIELISQLYVDIPQGDETTAYGVMAGFIATLPSARR